MVTTLATDRAMLIAGGALRRRAVVALAYGHTTRPTALRAPGPRSIRVSVFALLTRWSLHAAPASATVACTVTCAYVYVYVYVYIYAYVYVYVYVYMHMCIC